MKIAGLRDKGGWGEALAQEAAARGWDSQTFAPDEAQSVDADYAFMRIAQDHKQGAHDYSAYAYLAAQGTGMIPDSDTAEVYEDKWAQVNKYRSWMPQTLLLDTKSRAIEALGALGYPFVSKSRTGSASCNVRLVRNEAAAHQEIESAFGAGLTAPHKLGELAQKGYLIWQRFLPGNAYDYRVVRTGRYMMVLQRHNRADLPFASGSGRNNPAPMSNEVESLLRFADDFFTGFGINWCGIDVARDASGIWHLLETTLGWSQKAYLMCPYYRIIDGEVMLSYYTGADIWRLLCDEIEAGVFA